MDMDSANEKDATAPATAHEEYRNVWHLPDFATRMAELNKRMLRVYLGPVADLEPRASHRESYVPTPEEEESRAEAIRLMDELLKHPWIEDGWEGPYVRDFPEEVTVWDEPLEDYEARKQAFIAEHQDEIDEWRRQRPTIDDLLTLEAPRLRVAEEDHENPDHRQS